MDQESDLENWARKNGCWHKPYHTVRFYSDTVIAEDLHPGNIWMTGDNNVVIIDGSFKFNTPGLGLGGKFVY